MSEIELYRSQYSKLYNALYIVQQTRLLGRIEALSFSYQLPTKLSLAGHLASYSSTRRTPFPGLSLTLHSTLPSFLNAAEALPQFSSLPCTPFAPSRP